MSLIPVSPVQAFDERLVDAQVVHAAPLVAVAGAEDDDLDADCPADRAGTLQPRAIGKGSVVPLL